MMSCQQYSFTKKSQQIINSLHENAQKLLQYVDQFNKSHEKLYKQYDPFKKCYMELNKMQMKLLSTEQYSQFLKRVSKFLTLIKFVQQDINKDQLSFKKTQQKLSQLSKQLSHLHENCKNIITQTYVNTEIDLNSKIRTHQYLNTLITYLNTFQNQLSTLQK